MGKRWTREGLPEDDVEPAAVDLAPGAQAVRVLRHAAVPHVVILCGNAVGGGSITYANTMLVPPESVWREGSWKGLAELGGRDAGALRDGAAHARRHREPDPRRRRPHAEEDGRRRRAFGDTFYKTDVAVYFGADTDAPATEQPDPYFDGEGPRALACIGCGGCMVGCRFNAKNTLDKNYLYFAEKRGAKVMAETRVVDVRPLGDGGRRGRLRDHDRALDRVAVQAAQDVHRAAGRVLRVALGTMDLLLRMKMKGSLPAVSERLGHDVRTNSESLIGVRFPGKQFDMSKGIAIGSGIHIDRFTHIEATRYSRGSDALGLIATMLVTGKGWRRIFAWIGTAFRHPIQFFRAGWPFGFARQTLIFLVMQTIDATLQFRLRRRWFWPFEALADVRGAADPDEHSRGECVRRACGERVRRDRDHLDDRDPVRSADDRALHRRLRDGRRRRARRDRRAAPRVRLPGAVRRRRRGGRRQPRRQPEPDDHRARGARDDIHPAEGRRGTDAGHGGLRRYFDRRWGPSNFSRAAWIDVR